MAKPNQTNFYMRLIHRYLGFFLAGIMAVYSLSGVVLIFRTTDFLKKQININETIDANLSGLQLGEKLKIKGFKVDKEENGLLIFKEGTYNVQTGEAKYVKKELPVIMEKLTHLHKATTKDPLFFLNIFFGVSLLFFIISSFWMFLPGTKIFKKGLYFTLGGIILTLLMLFI